MGDRESTSPSALGEGESAEYLPGRMEVCLAPKLKVTSVGISLRRLANHARILRRGICPGLALLPFSVEAAEPSARRHRLPRGGCSGARHAALVSSAPHGGGVGHLLWRDPPLWEALPREVCWRFGACLKESDAINWINFNLHLRRASGAGGGGFFPLCFGCTSCLCGLSDKWLVMVLGLALKARACRKVPGSFRGIISR